MGLVLAWTWSIFIHFYLFIKVNVVISNTSVIKKVRFALKTVSRKELCLGLFVYFVDCVSTRADIFVCRNLVSTNSVWRTALPILNHSGLIGHIARNVI